MTNLLSKLFLLFALSTITIILLLSAIYSCGNGDFDLAQILSVSFGGFQRKRGTNKINYKFSGLRFCYNIGCGSLWSCVGYWLCDLWFV